MILASTKTIGQVYPFLTDVPSAGGSVISAGLYEFLIKKAEEKLSKEVDNYGNEYNKRFKYFGGALTSLFINKKIKELNERVNYLTKENKKLTFLYYSKKKQNIKSLALIKKSCDNIKDELQYKTGSFILSGERMNLYENLMKSILLINRVLDKVEMNINKSKRTFNFINNNI